MKYLNHLSTEQNLLRLVYCRTLALAKSLGEFATWLLTGEAAILGAVIINIEAISKVLSAPYIKWGIAMLVISLLFGVIARLQGLAICAALALTEEMYEELESPKMIEALLKTSISQDEFKTQLSSAFLPPLRGMMKRSFEHGSKDPLSGEKRLTRIFSIQLYLFWAQGLLGAAGMLGFGIK
jgi:hypothetical protein